MNKLWNPALTSVSDGFNLLCVCMEEKGMVFLGGGRHANRLNYYFQICVLTESELIGKVEYLSKVLTTNLSKMLPTKTFSSCCVGTTH